MARNAISPMDRHDSADSIELQERSSRPDSPRFQGEEPRPSSPGRHCPVRDSPQYIRRHIQRLNPQQWGSLQNLTWTSPIPPPFLKEIKAVPKQVQKAGRNINKFLDRGDIYLRTPLPMPEYTNFRLIFTLFDIATYIFDLASDIAVAYVLYNEDDTVWWFWLTVALIVVPHVLTNSHSLYWYWLSDHKCATGSSIFAKRSQISACWKAFRIMMHIFQVGTICRYLEILYYGLKSRKSRVQRMNIQGLYCPWPKRRKELEEQVDYFNLLVHAERDVSMLNLMLSFIQDAPQLVLQIYILAVRPPSLDGEELHRAFVVLVQVGSSLISLGSLALALTSYQRILRYAMLDKPNLSFGGQMFYFFWQSLVIASRVITLALFATQFKLIVFISVAVHWAVMIIWILLQRTVICVGENGEKKPCAEFLFNVVMGWVYVFCMINLKAAPGRLKYILYYTIYGAENVAMIVLWVLRVYASENRSWYMFPSIICVPVLFLLGTISMIVYYNVYHPDRLVPLPKQRAKLI